MSLKDFTDQLPAERAEATKQLQAIFSKNLPKGFEEKASAKALEYVVPHSLYPEGYHCNPKQALPFISIMNQKNALTLHHLGFYGSQELTDWFAAEYAKVMPTKLDMGKGCVRFKKMDQIPYDLIKTLAKKISPEDWIAIYEANFTKK